MPLPDSAVAQIAQNLARIGLEPAVHFKVIAALAPALAEAEPARVPVKEPIQPEARPKPEASGCPRAEGAEVNREVRRRLAAPTLPTKEREKKE